TRRQVSQTVLLRRHSAANSRQKAVGGLGRGNETAVTLAEPAIAAPRHEAIGSIAERTRYRIEDAGEPPPASEPRQDAQRRGRIAEGAPVFDEQERHRIIGIDSVTQEELPAGRRLHRREAEAPLIVARQQKAHPPAAEDADSVEDDDGGRSGGGHLADP